MPQPSPFNVSAYLTGDQPLWRAFWLWSVGMCGTVAATYAFVDRHFSGAVMEDSWAPLLRVLTVWAVLGGFSLMAIARCHANTKSPILAATAFLVIGLPTVGATFVLLWFLL